jgi:hypothetical protein
MCVCVQTLGARPTVVGRRYSSVPWCYSGATGVLQWCSMVLQGCYNGVTVVLQGCYSGVTVVLQWHHLTSPSSHKYTRNGLKEVTSTYMRRSNFLPSIRHLCMCLCVCMCMCVCVCVCRAHHFTLGWYHVLCDAFDIRHNARSI